MFYSTTFELITRLVITQLHETLQMHFKKLLFFAHIVHFIFKTLIQNFSNWSENKYFTIAFCTNLQSSNMRLPAVGSVLGLWRLPRACIALMKKKVKLVYTEIKTKCFYHLERILKKTKIMLPKCSCFL